jgi:undecaprenyl diphosphate synthase
LKDEIARLKNLPPRLKIHADFYVVDDYGPDFKPEHFDQVLTGFKAQDQTLGGATAHIAPGT